MPSPESSLPFLEETSVDPSYLLFSQSYLCQNKTPQPKLPSKYLLPVFILVKKNQLYSHKTEKRESLIAKLNSSLVIKLEPMLFL